MHIISKVYSDNTAEVIDLNTFSRIELSEIELIRTKLDIKGLTVYKNKIVNLTAYTFYQFPDENEAIDYLKHLDLSHKNKIYCAGYWWILAPKNEVIKVNYYVCAYAGNEVCFVSENGYTPYIQGAKIFDKKEAGERAALMTKNSKTGKYWTAQRVVVE